MKAHRDRTCSQSAAGACRRCSSISPAQPARPFPRSGLRRHPRCQCSCRRERCLFPTTKTRASLSRVLKMYSHRENQVPFNDDDELIGPSSAPASGPPSSAVVAPAKMGPVQKVIVALLLTAVIVPPLSGFYSFFSGVPLHLLGATKKEQEETSQSPAQSSVSLVSGLAHTLAVPDEVATALGIRKGRSDSVAIARAPTTMRPLVLPGSTRFDPARLDRIRGSIRPRAARFGQARIDDEASSGNQPFRWHGVRAEQTDAQGRAVDGTRSGRGFLAHRNPPARRARPCLRDGGTQSRARGPRVATGEDVESSARVDAKRLIGNSTEDCHDSQTDCVGAR